MSNYKIGIIIPAASTEDAQQLAKLLQDVANKVSFADMVKLLSAASKKPAIIKTALKFM
jgi:hypothetical protein